MNGFSQKYDTDSLCSPGIFLMDRERAPSVLWRCFIDCPYRLVKRGVPSGAARHVVN